MIPWLKSKYVPQITALNLFRRYLMLEPAHVELYIAYLIEYRHYDE